MADCRNAKHSAKSCKHTETSAPWRNTNVVVIKASDEPRVNEVELFALGPVSHTTVEKEGELQACSSGVEGLLASKQALGLNPSTDKKKIPA